jgi:hypothetical protein
MQEPGPGLPAPASIHIPSPTGPTYSPNPNPNPNPNPSAPLLAGRGNRPASRWRLLSTAAGIVIVAALTLILVASGVGTVITKPPSESPAKSQDSRRAGRELLERMRAEIVPQDDAPTLYGVRFNAEGYETLLSWHSQYRVTRAQASLFESLDLTLPCCAFGLPSADEEKNCACGHHRALYGLSKRLLGLRYGQKAVQVEVGRWAAYFFPGETLQAALAERAGSDPAFGEALEELRQKGGC